MHNRNNNNNNDDDDDNNNLQGAVTMVTCPYSHYKGAKKQLTRA